MNYDVEALILGELGDPMLGDRKVCSFFHLCKKQKRQHIIQIFTQVIHYHF